MNYDQIVFIRKEIAHLEQMIDWFVFEAQNYSNQYAQDSILNKYESQLKAWKHELILASRNKSNP